MDREPKLPTVQIDPRQVAEAMLSAAVEGIGCSNHFAPTNSLNEGPQGSKNGVMHRRRSGASR
jgi:hypothetical protein